MWPTHYLSLQDRIEGEPPPRFYYTTPPYPYEWEDALESSAPQQGGGFNPSFEAVEELESSASFASGVLNDCLVFIDARFEELESNPSFVSGVLNDILVAIDARFEELESTGSFVSGALTDPLVIYDNWPLAADQEDLLSTGSFVSGVLA